MTGYKKFLLLLAVAVLVAASASLIRAKTTSPPMQPKMAPMATATIPDAAMQRTELSEFVEHVRLAGLRQALQARGPFTVFAPTDSAFKKIPANTMKALMEPKNRAMLASILKYHVVRGSYPSSKLAKMKDGSTLTTLDGKTLTISQMNGSVYVGKYKVSKADIKASNGIIHEIDGVMMPPK